MTLFLFLIYIQNKKGCKRERVGTWGGSGRHYLQQSWAFLGYLQIGRFIRIAILIGIALDVHQLRRIVLWGALGRAGDGGGWGARVVARVAAIVVAVAAVVGVVVAVAGSAATLLLLQLTQSLLFLALLFAPLGSAILEPHLEERERGKKV